MHKYVDERMAAVIIFCTVKTKIPTFNGGIWENKIYIII